MLEYLIGAVILYIILFICTYLVSFFGNRNEILSIASVAGFFTILYLCVTFFEINPILSFLINGIASLILFTKFLEFEPMPALMGGILFNLLVSFIIMTILL